MTGFTTTQAIRATGASKRQFEWWNITGLVTPSIRSAQGSGRENCYSVEDIVLLLVIRKLLNTGLSLQRVRTFIEHLRSKGDDMRGSFVSDGTHVARFTDLDMETVLVDFGPTWFAINVSVAYREVEEKLGLVKAGGGL